MAELLDERESKWVAEALAALGIRNLVFSLHDASFPGRHDDDLGRGSPYSKSADGLLRYVRRLGFTGLQLGPQGLTSPGNPSPYDGTLFSRSILNAYLPELAEGRWSRLLDFAHVADLIRVRPDGALERVAHAHVYPLVQTALETACMNLLRGKGPAEARKDVLADFSAFTGASASWLEPDALYEALCADHQVPYWRDWPDELDRRLFAPESTDDVTRATKRRQEVALRHALFVEYAFAQFVVHAQHRYFRERLRDLGMKVYGDLQVGRSPADVWVQQATFLRGYLMGAPPSRTNPAGQDWNYPVMDPRQFHAPDGSMGPALRLVRARMQKLFAEYDGIRIDHPHGLVTPWVYRDVPGGVPERLEAVRAGARLFDSPDLADHPELQALAIARPEQLDRAQPRYGDRWVRTLEEDQVRRYSTLFEVIAATCKEHGHDVRDLVCEVLSTQPYPLQRVMERYGLGRFRVTQKVNLDDGADVYRSENAAPADWIMLGNHDTRPIWRVVEDWTAQGKLEAHARYLAGRLAPQDETRREALKALLAKSPQLIAQAKCAELFASKAQNAMVFFTDLLGMKDAYNTPGTVADSNWSLRVPPDYEERYPKALEQDEAMNLPWALSWALTAKGLAPELAENLAQVAARLRGGKQLP